MSIASILIDFSNSFIIHDEKTKEFIALNKVWKYAALIVITLGELLLRIFPRIINCLRS